MSPLTPITGVFFRSILADQLDKLLAPPGPESAGRYHRPGQPALYMSPCAQWSTIAVSGYMREDGRPRVVVPLRLDNAFVLDQRVEAACQIAGINRELSNHSWRTALAQNHEPASWKNADIARELGADGMIDCSRMIPNGWHLCLFRWNVPGAPTVAVCGEPVAIRLSENGPKWGL